MAACTQHPDESPLDVAGGVEGRFKSRHFALHALIAVFPDASPRDLARAVGFHRHTGAALAASMRMCGGARGVKWWSDLILRDVIAVVRSIPGAGEPVSASAKVETGNRPPEAKLASAGSVGARPARRVVVPAEPDRTMTRREAPARPIYRSPLIGESKQALRDMLAQAVRNTAAKTPPAES